MKHDTAIRGVTIMGLALLILFTAIRNVPAFQESSETGDEKQKTRGFVLLPILSYMPETKLAGGAFVNYYFREAGSDRDSRPSTIVPSLIYTQKKQISFEISTDLYWHNQAHNLKGYVSYSRFPDKYYGIGPDTPEENEEDYTPRMFQLRLNYQKRVFPDLYLGVQYEIEHTRLIKVEERGLLDSGGVPGSEGGLTSGIGLTLNRDTRDNVFSPASGSLHQLTLRTFGGWIGSDYDFSELNIDLRAYRELFPSHVLVVNGYANLISGEAPFQKLSLLGQVGLRNLMRGYYQGRYRDKNIFVLQTEYRFPLWKRLGAGVFLSAGDVAGRLEDFRLGSLKYAFGGGLRFKLNQKEKINLRLDFGFGSNTSGFYITIGEAF